jgi:hypothetical protein
VVAQILLGDAVFAFPGDTVDYRHPVGAGPAADSAGEPAGQPHQVRII